MHKFEGSALCASLGTPTGVFPGGAFVYFRILGLPSNYSRELQSKAWSLLKRVLKTVLLEAERAFCLASRILRRSQSHKASEV